MFFFPPSDCVTKKSSDPYDTALRQGAEVAFQITEQATLFFFFFQFSIVIWAVYIDVASKMCIL